MYWGRGCVIPCEAVVAERIPGRNVSLYPPQLICPLTHFIGCLYYRLTPL